MRQYGEVPPVLSTALAPAISAATGLGTGGGAGVQTPDGQGWGAVIVRAGPGAPAGGSLTLVYPQTPPAMFYGPSEAFGTLAVAGQGTTTHVLSWTGTLTPNQPHRIAYEWGSSF